MRSLTLGFVVGLLATSGCHTVPGRDVRYEPTPMEVVRAMLRLARVDARDVVYDLWSGDGRIPITAAKEFGARGVGIEIDPALVAKAQANARAAGVADRVEFRLGDMYAADVRAASVVTLFLHPEPNLKLRPKLRSELRPGARILGKATGGAGEKMAFLGIELMPPQLLLEALQEQSAHSPHLPSHAKLSAYFKTLETGANRVSDALRAGAAMTMTDAEAIQTFVGSGFGSLRNAYHDAIEILLVPGHAPDA